MVKPWPNPWNPPLNRTSNHQQFLPSHENQHRGSYEKSSHSERGINNGIPPYKNRGKKPNFIKLKLGDGDDLLLLSVSSSLWWLSGKNLIFVMSDIFAVRKPTTSPSTAPSGRASASQRPVASLGAMAEQCPVPRWGWQKNGGFTARHMGNMEV
jgi:hypothetical protein